MIKNYLKTALRSLLKDRVYALINVLGLSIGLGCFVLVFAFNRKELSYDKAYSKASDPTGADVEREYVGRSSVPYSI